MNISHFTDTDLKKLIFAIIVVNFCQNFIKIILNESYLKIISYSDFRGNGYTPIVGLLWPETYCYDGFNSVG